MDETITTILKIVGIDVNNVDGALIPRETLINSSLYDEVKTTIPDLKKRFSSSYMTSLHNNAGATQKWPMLNLVRQILHSYHYTMKPIRKSDGYTKQGVKKYKRFFLISKSLEKTNVVSDDDDIVAETS